MAISEASTKSRRRHRSCAASARLLRANEPGPGPGKVEGEDVARAEAGPDFHRIRAVVVHGAEHTIRERPFQRDAKDAFRSRDGVFELLIDTEMHTRARPDLERRLAAEQLPDADQP